MVGQLWGVFFISLRAWFDMSYQHLLALGNQFVAHYLSLCEIRLSISQVSVSLTWPKAAHISRGDGDLIFSTVMLWAECCQIMASLPTLHNSTKHYTALHLYLLTMRWNWIWSSERGVNNLFAIFVDSGTQIVVTQANVNTSMSKSWADRGYIYPTLTQQLSLHLLTPNTACHTTPGMQLSTR